MLEFLSEWVEGIAIAVIIASIFEMILPKGNIKKYVKMILGVYVIFSIISPFVDSNALYSFDIDETIDEYTENISNSLDSTESSSNNDLNEMYVSSFEDEIIELIETQGYEVSECNVDAILDSDDEDAGIKEIYIKLESKTNIDNNTNDENSISINSVETIEEVEIAVGDNKTSESNEENDISSSDVKELKTYISEKFEIDENVINIDF